MPPDNRGLTDADIELYMEKLSNWGRWGPDDQRGALNYLTPEKRVAAAALVRTGEVVATSLPLPTTPGPTNPMPVLHFMMATGEGEDSSGSRDFFGFAYHGRTISHLDALCHFFWKGKMYNGYPSKLVRPDGAEKNAIHQVREHVSGRGVLLDVAAARGKQWLDSGEAIYVEDLEAAERVQGVTAREGDILLIRTGRFHKDRPPVSSTESLAGLHASVLPWLFERRIAVLGGDGTNDVSPSGFSIRLPVHTVTLVSMGLHLLDNQYFEPLAEACRRAGRYEFFYVVAPLYLERGTGSPATGLAMF